MATYSVKAFDSITGRKVSVDPCIRKLTNDDLHNLGISLSSNEKVVTFINLDQEGLMTRYRNGILLFNKKQMF